MKLRQKLATALMPAVDLLFPPRCPLCGDSIGTQSGLCLACWGKLEAPRPDQQNGNERIIAATTYNAQSRDLLLRLKYGRKISLVPFMARLMHGQLTRLAEWHDRKWIIVPVPLHWTRLWRRGYNQSALLAQEVAKLSGHPCLVDGLVRSKATPSLGNLNASVRAGLLDGAIELKTSRANQLKGHHILLIDDVYTTGATSGTCARALMHAGAASVVTVCFAKAGRESQ